MVKKIIAFSLSVVMVGALAMPVAAHGHRSFPSIGLDVDMAKVRTNVSAAAYTGGNVQGNVASVTSMARRTHHSRGYGNVVVTGNNVLDTGRANAVAAATVSVNEETNCNSCRSHSYGHHQPTSIVGDLSMANVKTSVVSVADTGANEQGNMAMVQGRQHGNVRASGNNTMTTGSADATARSWVTVNPEWNAGR